MTTIDWWSAMSRLEAVCNALRVGNLAQFAHDVDFVDKEQYLTEVLERALQHREARRVERLIKQARFPAPRTFEGYEFEPITFPSGIDKDGLMNLAFLERRENVLGDGYSLLRGRQLGERLVATLDSLEARCTLTILHDYAASLSAAHSVSASLRTSAGLSPSM